MPSKRGSYKTNVSRKHLRPVRIRQSTYTILLTSVRTLAFLTTPGKWDRCTHNTSQDPDLWFPNRWNTKATEFLIDENETIGKDGASSHGPDAVISMIDWALSEYIYWTIMGAVSKIQRRIARCKSVLDTISTLYEPGVIAVTHCGR